MLLFKARIRDDPSQQPRSHLSPENTLTEANSGAEEMGDENDEKVGTRWGM